MQPNLINASSRPLNEASSNLPDLSAAVMGFLYPMTFQIWQTTLVDGYAQSVPVKICTQACIQPFTARMLKVKPEGERAWTWYLIYSLTNLDLKLNDRISIEGVRYKVMETLNWSRNQYYEYHVILDYQYQAGQTQGQ